MNKSLILNELLENWNLKHTHIKILDVLIGKELTAQQITKALNSKKQIIYPALNQLTEFSLIKRNEIGPQQMFSCIDFYKHIDGFINYKNKEFVNNQTRLLDLKKNDAIPHIAKVTSHKNYSDNMISMFNEETFIRIVTRIYSVPSNYMVLILKILSNIEILSEKIVTCFQMIPQMITVQEWLRFFLKNIRKK